MRVLVLGSDQSDQSDRSDLSDPSSFWVRLQSGYPEHPQNCDPARAPWRAVRRTMGLLQSEQAGPSRLSFPNV